MSRLSKVFIPSMKTPASTPSWFSAGGSSTQGLSISFKNKMQHVDVTSLCSIQTLRSSSPGNKAISTNFAQHAVTCSLPARTAEKPFLNVPLLSRFGCRMSAEDQEGALQSALTSFADEHGLSGTNLSWLTSHEGNKEVQSAAWATLRSALPNRSCKSADKCIRRFLAPQRVPKARLPTCIPLA